MKRPATTYARMPYILAGLIGTAVYQGVLSPSACRVAD